MGAGILGRMLDGSDMPHRCIDPEGLASVQGPPVGIYPMKLQIYWQIPDFTEIVKPDLAGTSNFVPAA